MTDDLLLDTDVLIEYLRQRAEAVQFLESLSEPPATSAISVAELYAGVREGREILALDDLTEWLEVIVVDQKIAKLGGIFRRDYSKNHGISLTDALIAATAVVESKRLVTFNRKHFRMLDDVVAPYNRY